MKQNKEEIPKPVEDNLAGDASKGESQPRDSWLSAMLKHYRNSLKESRRQYELNRPEAILDNMNKDERSLLTYFESCLVNQRGYCEARRMNEVDFEIAGQWVDVGFVQFRRRPAKDIVGTTTVRAYEVRFSEEAWELAHIERRRRAERNLPKTGGNHAHKNQETHR